MGLTPKRGRGQPTTYTEAKAAEICRRVAEGKSINTICKSADMPDQHTVYDWRARHIEFDQMYARARGDQADSCAEEMLDVARRKSRSSVDATDNRLLVDTLKWRAAKLKPRLYGDKLTVDAEVNVRQMSDEEINARLAHLFAHPGEGKG